MRRKRERISKSQQKKYSNIFPLTNVSVNVGERTCTQKDSAITKIHSSRSFWEETAFLIYDGFSL